MIVTVSAIIFASLSGIIILFQLGLALGLPWGKASMGGKFPGKYPPKMRIVGLVNSMVICIIIVVVLIKANLLLPRFKSFSDIIIYFVVGFSLTATIMNIITPSKIERNIWAPVAAILFVTSFIVAFVTVK